MERMHCQHVMHWEDLKIWMLEERASTWSHATVFVSKLLWHGLLSVWQGLRFWLTGLSKPTTPQKACFTVFRSTSAWERTVCWSHASSCQRNLLIEIN
jgi:hypothetical protein